MGNEMKTHVHMTWATGFQKAKMLCLQRNLVRKYRRLSHAEEGIEGC